MQIKNTIYALIVSILILLVYMPCFTSDDGYHPLSDVYVDDDAAPSWYDATHVKTITEGIANTTANSTVYVYPGTYTASFTINKNIRLVAYNSTKPQINGLVTISEYLSGPVVVDGFSIDGLSNSYAIYIRRADNVSVTNCTIYCGSGSYWVVAQGRYCNFSYCNFSGTCFVGIRLTSISSWTEGENVLWFNDIDGAGVTAGYAVEVYTEVGGNTLIGNNISNISSGNIGIYVEDNNNVIYHNNILNISGDGAQDDGVGTVWDGGYGTYPDDIIGGNYWSDADTTDDYHGPDQDIAGGDGICDAVYVIDGNDDDNYALTEPYSGGGGEPLPSYPGDTTLFPDAKMHFPQYPDPLGWDIDWGLDTTGRCLADDWQCNETGNVTDIHFWVSTWKDLLPPDDITYLINTSMIFICSNNLGMGYSYPDTLLWLLTGYTINIAGPFLGDEGWYEPPVNYSEHNHDYFWRIDIENISSQFYQEAGTIYWLMIYAPIEINLIGWKTSPNHFMDNAVYGYPGEWHPLENPVNFTGLDLAFVITGEAYAPPGPNNPPNQPVVVHPTNNSKYTLINTYLSVLVTDPDGDPMNVVFYWANNSEIGINWNVPNGEVASVYLPDYRWIEHETDYSWYTVAYDPYYLSNTSDIWNFTTCRPYDLTGSGDVNYLSVSVLVSHYGNTISDATQEVICRPNMDGLVTWVPNPPLPVHFPLEMEPVPDDPLSFVFEAPPVGGPELYFLVNTPSYTYNILNLTLVARMSSLAGGGIDPFQHVIWNGMLPIWSAPWFIIPAFPVFADYSTTWATDPYGGDWTWAGLTAYQFGVDQSGVPFLSPTMMTQFYVDVFYTTPGNEAWDINNDGDVSYLDVSSLVSHYGESY